MADTETGDLFGGGSDAPIEATAGNGFIKRLKKELRQQGIKKNIPDLLALTPDNDPFNSGAPGNINQAKWFSDAIDRMGLRTSGVHTRRIHYRVVSQDPPPALWNGKVYENTETCWGALQNAGKQARYLKMVDAELFDDRRNPPPVVFPPTEPDQGMLKELWFGAHLSRADSRPELVGCWIGPSINDAIDDWQIPESRAIGYRYDPADAEGFHLKLWIEKSTMEDVLLPICEEHGITYVPAIGFQSITGTIRLLQRLENFARLAGRKPTRIFYVSDFDPAGDAMPPAIARQSEFWLLELEAKFDIKLTRWP
ncbi:MAG: hypothetical protein ACOYMW_16620 [Candidatus Competibacteraceae bacterium]